MSILDNGGGTKSFSARRRRSRSTECAATEIGQHARSNRRWAPYAHRPRAELLRGAATTHHDEGEKNSGYDGWEVLPRLAVGNRADGRRTRTLCCFGPGRRGVLLVEHAARLARQKGVTCHPGRSKSSIVGALPPRRHAVVAVSVLPLYSVGKRKTRS